MFRHAHVGEYMTAKLHVADLYNISYSTIQANMRLYTWMHAMETQTELHMQYPKWRDSANCIISLHGHIPLLRDSILEEHFYCKTRQVSWKKSNTAYIYERLQEKTVQNIITLYDLFSLYIYILFFLWITWLIHDSLPFLSHRYQIFYLQM